jgi:hypothetical protein
LHGQLPRAGIRQHDQALGIAYNYAIPYLSKGHGKDHLDGCVVDCVSTMRSDAVSGKKVKGGMASGSFFPRRARGHFAETFCVHFVPLLSIKNIH